MLRETKEGREGREAQVALRKPRWASEREGSAARRKKAAGETGRCEEGRSDQQHRPEGIADEAIQSHGLIGVNEVATVIATANLAIRDYPGAGFAVPAFNARTQRALCDRTRTKTVSNGILQEGIGAHQQHKAPQIDCRLSPIHFGTLEFFNAERRKEHYRSDGLNQRQREAERHI